jgi:hypothetical protein
MTEQVRQVLDQIDDALTNLPVDEARDLWNILTALRGPDDPRIASEKGVTTVVIRTHAFPKMAATKSPHPSCQEGFSRLGCQVADPSKDDVDLVESFSANSLHFAYHTQKAARALELKLTPRPDRSPGGGIVRMLWS